MLKMKNQPQHIRSAKLLLVIGLALLFTFIFSFPSSGIGVTSVYAQQTKPLDNGPAILSINAGFNGTYRVGNWIPIQVKVSNSGSEFDGLISVSLSTLYTGNTSTSVSLYQTAISLPAISQKQITLYVPIEAASGVQSAPSSLTVHLQDNNNHEVTKKSVTINSVASNELYIGLISDHALDVRQLTSALSGQNAHTHIEPLSASSLPAGGGLASALNNFDMLILDNTVTSTLNNDQDTALQAWVHQGGTLIEVGGPEWHSTLGALPTSLLPVTITGTDTVAAGQHLLPQQGSGTGSNSTDDTLSTAVPVSVATAKSGSMVLLASNNTPLIVQGNVGQGQVYYLAYDPFLDPLVNWTNTSSLWSNLLMRTLGDQILTINNGNAAYNSASGKYSLYGSMNNFLETLIPNAFPSIWLILTLLISYVLILGPLRFFLIRWSKKKAWSWRIVLATIVLFSLLSYGLALQVKGTSVVSSNVTVIQLSQPDSTGSQAHVTDYVGVYVPGNGDFHVHLPGVNLVEATDQSSPYGPNFMPGIQGGSGQSSTEQTAITTQASSTDVDLQGADNWTLRVLASKYDTHMQGGISSNLSFSQNVITGTVTNTLPYTLNDAYLLAGNDYIALGKLESGQTQSVQLAVTNQTSTQNNGMPGTLADQIASSRGVNANQNNYLSVFGSAQAPTDENYRHISMLEALSGGNCNVGPCFKNYGGPQFIQPHLLDGPERGYSQDPLLIAGAPATIIGWISNPASTANITINNSSTPGTQESLIQAPANLRFAGQVNVPATLSTGQIVDVQPGPNSSNLPQETGPDTYTLTTGSITFELQLPVTGNLQAPTLTFNDAAITSKMGYVNPGQGSTNDVNTMHVGLYNWQTNSWDNETFSNDTFSIADAQNYIGPNGRVLIQLANGQNSQNATVFTMPGVALNATILK